MFSSSVTVSSELHRFTYFMLPFRILGLVFQHTSYSSIHQFRYTKGTLESLDPLKLSKCQTQFMGNLFPLRDINWTKGRKLSQRRGAPGLIEEASRGLQLQVP